MCVPVLEQTLSSSTNGVGFSQLRHVTDAIVEENEEVSVLMIVVNRNEKLLDLEASFDVTEVRMYLK